MSDENEAVDAEALRLARPAVNHHAERVAHDRQRAEAAKQRERVHWVVHEKDTGRVLRRGYCARENVAAQALHDGEGVIELEEHQHHITAHSHDVDVETGALVTRRRPVKDLIANKRRSLELAFDAAVQSDFNAMAHSDHDDPLREFKEKRQLHRTRLGDLVVVLDRAGCEGDVDAINW